MDSAVRFDRYEQAMVDFVTRWYQFGGGSAQDIFEEFGLSEQAYFTRVLELLDTAVWAAPRQNTMVRNAIRNTCHWRLQYT